MGKEEGLRADLKRAQMRRDSAIRCMNTKPDEYSYWLQVFTEASVEVAQLERELAAMSSEASS